MSADARSYLSKALDIMEKNALIRHQVDWAEVRRHAFSQAGAAQQPSGTYNAIRSALWTVGDGHSSFFAPKEAKEAAEVSPDSSFEGPKGRSLGNRIGYVSVPPVQGSDAMYQRYVRQGREAVAKADRPGACGWVVDLRGNHGGNMWPMLAVAGPILGDGEVGMFVDSDGKTSPWTIHNGIPSEDGKPYNWGNGEPVATPHAPIAVLTDRTTASSGEAVAVAFRGGLRTRSFGQATYGVPTGKNDHRLSDGAVLGLAEVKDADRTGRSYHGRIPPDEQIATTGIKDGSTMDQVLQAARNWLLKQAACQ
ncbi:S41 family peptidase [Streptomyces sp. NPDC002677]|uniref:S41 family peptidase n=1 Tax=Streptomyces sp. NPDC002677 TaxID=3154774 RepID=UPI00331A5F61